MGSGRHAARPESAQHVFQYWFKTNPGGGPNINGTKWFVWWANGAALPAGDSATKSASKGMYQTTAALSM